MSTSTRLAILAGSMNDSDSCIHPLCYNADNSKLKLSKMIYLDQEDHALPKVMGCPAR